MNVAIALSAIDNGAVVANHVEVVDLLKKEAGGKTEICGAVLKDEFTGEHWEIFAKVVHLYLY